MTSNHKAQCLVNTTVYVNAIEIWNIDPEAGENKYHYSGFYRSTLLLQ